MLTRILIPKLDANTAEATIVEWYRKEGEAVAHGEPLLAIETDKAVVDIESEASGVLLRILAHENERIRIPSVVGLMGGSVEELDSPEFLKELESIGAARSTVQQRVAARPKASGLVRKTMTPASPAARRIAREHNIDLGRLTGTGGRGEVTVKDVEAFLSSAMQPSRNTGARRDRLRVLVVGAGDGGKIVSEVLSLDPAVEVVGFLDDNEELWGKELAGCVVFGATDQISALIRGRAFDSVAISITSNMAVRRNLYDRYKALGVRFTNVVHPSAYISPSASIGSGNLIYGNVHIGTETRIGDNNLLSAHCSIDHHNVVGDHNLFGPGVLTSGAVVIGNDCIFGAGVCIEPRLRIGNNVRVASGTAISFHVPDGVILKSRFSAKSAGMKDIQP